MIPWDLFFCNNFVIITNIKPPDDFLCNVAATGVFLFTNKNKPRKLLCKAIALTFLKKKKENNCTKKLFFVNRFFVTILAALVYSSKK